METCSLCALKLPDHSIRQGPSSFCCHGCQAVFNILLAKQELENFHSHPVFLQAIQAGLISNPNLLQEVRTKQLESAGEMTEKIHLEIGELWCPSCAEVIQLMLAREKGIRACVADYTTDVAVVEYSPKSISKEKICSIIQKLGYTAQPLQISQDQALGRTLNLRFAVAAFCALNLMMFTYPLYATYFDHEGEEMGSLLAWISFFVSLPVLLYSGWPIFKKFINGLKVGIWGMEALVFAGITASFVLSTYEILVGTNRVYFDSMSIIIAFVLLGKIIESKAKFSAKETLLRLVRTSPKRVRRREEDGSSQFVPIKDVKKGDYLLVLTGEKIPLDGVVVEGEASCDEALMTGEAIPILKKPGSPLVGGSIVTHGWLCFQVSAELEGTTLQKIVQIVEKDINHKARYVRAADRIARWFVPIVFLIAVGAIFLSGDFTEGLIRGIAVVLISCPCAIGIAAPLAESHLLNGFVNQGALIRNRAIIPTLGKETVWIFDKTGTVTHGHFSVLSGLETLTEIDKMALRSLAHYSNHPIARGISSSLQEVPLQAIELFQEMAGLGMSGKIGGNHYLVGSAQFLTQNEIGIPDISTEETINTLVHIAKNGQYLTSLELGDILKSGVRELIRKLKPARSILLSGDSNRAVAAVAKACDFDEWKGECQPLQKREFVEKLRFQGETVGMVGDGINDAPSLALAHTGISVFSATDMSVQVSDLLLTTERLEILPNLIKLAEKGRKLIKQNLFWAFFYNCVGIGLAAMGLLTPIFATFAMAASSLIVLFNARRLSTN